MVLYSATATFASGAAAAFDASAARSASSAKAFSPSSLESNPQSAIYTAYEDGASLSSTSNAATLPTNSSPDTTSPNTT